MAITFRNTKSHKSDFFFVGIDQSITHTGMTIITKDYKILFAQGLTTTTDISFEERLLSIKTFILDKIKTLPPESTSIAIEGLAFNRTKTNNSAMLFGLFSIIITALCEAGYKYSIIPPTTLKKIATGNGRASKEDMINKINNNDIKKLLKLSGIKSKEVIKFEDIADSFWLSIAKRKESS